ncbi:cob(I)yrinic acid a,c-diamide adenosyltransferase [Bacteroides sp. 214]|uniref:cob(I)yrinic acid a,c-diamide adenosyltransferase n=1 Tax=Bacteroides sp. 214 TaxID=2302935 RepID=UPI0013D0B4B0|nr:cob(I)yrinic acid a,c-diamide adenosyltransferase [Bacteroides sp. 214]NDW13049.1 cob(I)yrinic acid a,c-diamide adenosyltransferase [Bacteroides sp. 214]
MKKSMVYTKTGDKGSSGLIGGTRVSKTDIRLEAYGTVDEFNAQLGVLCTYLTDEHDKEIVLNIQDKLFTIGAHLATDQEKVTLSKSSIITHEHIEGIEKEIDRVDSQLPPLKAFVIPGGCRAAAVCHVCRTVCRRVERKVVALSETYPVALEVMAYINRISDYLFVLSRKLNIQSAHDEIFWNNSCK